MSRKEPGVQEAGEVSKTLPSGSSPGPGANCVDCGRFVPLANMQSSWTGTHWCSDRSSCERVAKYWDNLGDDPAAPLPIEKCCVCDRRAPVADMIYSGGGSFYRCKDEDACLRVSLRDKRARSFAGLSAALKSGSIRIPEPKISDLDLPWPPECWVCGSKDVTRRRYKGELTLLCGGCGCRLAVGARRIAHQPGMTLLFQDIMPGDEGKCCVWLDHGGCRVLAQPPDDALLVFAEGPDGGRRGYFLRSTVHAWVYILNRVGRDGR